MTLLFPSLKKGFIALDLLAQLLSLHGQSFGRRELLRLVGPVSFKIALALALHGKRIAQNDPLVRGCDDVRLSALGNRRSANKHRCSTRLTTLVLPELRLPSANSRFTLTRSYS